MGIAKSWNLSWRLRMAIACCALAYLIFEKPWTQSSQSIAADSYSCAAALFTLALIPKGTRLWMAIGAAFGVALLVVIASSY